MDLHSFFQHYGPVLSFVLALLYFHNQNVTERRASDDRWANLKTEGDNRWAALKTEGDNRWSELQKQWADGQREITALMRRMNMIEDDRG